MFKSSQFLDIVSQSDEDLVNDEFSVRKTNRADPFCSEDSARHNAKVAASSPGNSQSSSNDPEHRENRTDATVYEQYEKGSLSELENTFVKFRHVS